ncbi:response regulator [Paenibacillus sp. GP183]|uniref:response regulator n=1 Tax=Paenibacillus sp. GP183 TaxID=1882751 RepID=UPI000896FF8D|nr:response regulator [Paenibacillus sp. GP183]SEC67394.1 two-component system, response regulator YesN [Paenibacillus sp. GP183]
MKLKAMLVDDELPILNNLNRVLPWDNMDIEVVKLARNGSEAMEGVRLHRPDIILCDIRMPIMDGMTFLAEVRKIDSVCEILMLTGYQEFEYARTAIQFGVRDYILKPIDYDKLEKTVRKIADSLLAERAMRMKKDSQWDKAAHLANDKILYDVLMGLSAADEHHLLPFDDQDADDLIFTFLLVDIEGYSQHSLHWTDKERKLWNFAVGNVLREALLQFQLKYSALQIREGEWCVLIEHHHSDASDASLSAQVWLQTLQNAVSDNVKLSVNVGVYPGTVSFDGLAGAYKNMQRIMLQHAGSNRIFSVTEENLENQEANRSLWNIMEEIMSGLRQLERTKMDKALQNLRFYLAADDVQFPIKSESFMSYLLIQLLREMREMDIVTSKLEESVWKKLQYSMSMKDVMETIVHLTDHALETALSKKTSELLMISAKEYIHRCLSSDIGVEEVADHLGISNSYFSLLFKAYFGETFVEYVTKQRMEQAKSMLRASDKSIAKICSLVGFAQRRYFTKVFQKYTGMTPSEYREIKGGSGGETG